ncbi:hypothetical protein [Cellvibrio mixtus]|uniref:hypothetical protein n=1 Tax=Cellvibrio mixtus TaxID=39650 RepID=UPI0005864D33|nr:hypothetical protein [Cellvibrio mixtus]
MALTLKNYLYNYCFWITFRIHDEKSKKDGRDYDDRYNALHAAVEKLSGGQEDMMWKESSSFIAFRSDKNLDGVCKDLRGAIDPSIDVLIVHRLNDKKHHDGDKYLGVTESLGVNDNSTAFRLCFPVPH